MPAHHRPSPCRAQVRALHRRDAIVRSAHTTAPIVTAAAIHLCSSVRYHDAALCCPACGGDALQRDGLRIRDADSIGVRFTCEACAEVSELHIESDKGRVFLAWA
jgi:hypothetical protein